MEMTFCYVTFCFVMLVISHISPVKSVRARQDRQINRA